MNCHLACAALIALSAIAGAGEAVAILNDQLENAHRLTDKVIAGAEPHGERAFQALKDLGVKTVISVDGSTPNIELAHRYGLRYVHLPIGYDGVPVERSRELAKALTELEGPIYVHCHHGQHRGPAAAASACVVAGWLSNDEAVASMKKLGTGENYLGLWASAQTAKKATPEELKALKVEFRETSPIPPLAEAMVHVDEAFDHLGECKQAGWKAPQDHPDLDPAHEALKLREILFEAGRTDDFKARPDEFKKLAEKNFADAKRLEELLNARKKEETISLKDIDAAYSAIQGDCKACHQSYRNTKKK